MRTKGTGDFLFELDHTHITFSLIVIERDSEVVHEGEYLRFVSMESVEEVLGFGLFGFASTRVRLSWWRIGGKALLENLIVSSFKISKRDGIEAGSLGLRILDDLGNRLLDIKQQGLHPLSPRLVILFMG